MRVGIQSIEIGTAVLRALVQAPGPLQLRDVAQAAHMPPSKTYKYLVSLTDVGLVRQDEASGRYDLGPFALELGLAALGRIDEIDIVAAGLGQITAELQRDAEITTWGAAGPTVIRWKQGSRNVSIRVKEGSILPVLTSATGCVWACYLPKAQTERLIEAELDVLVERTGQKREALQSFYDKKIADVRRRGLASAEGELRSGIDALAGPVFGPSGLAFVMTMLAPHHDTDLSHDGAIANRFRDILQKTSDQLGAALNAGDQA
ncbi:MAG TPA: IclR family transcriptional regulator [Devosiaceae bacterium]|jgi:DNA-binding IclR family transcriptional regulator